MIEELAITDLGVIHESRLPLGPGFTAITGETGAGKTMVVTALGLLMGERADAQLVRHGSERARVAGVIRLGAERSRDAEIAGIVDDAGGEIEDDELLLSRTVTAEGRSRATVGGVRAPVGALATLATHLFCVHGQSDQLRLRSAAEQRNTLDRFGGDTVLPILREYREVHALRQAREKELTEITGAREARRREAERLRHEVDEITAVNPVEGEDKELDARLERLTNLETLRGALAQAVGALAADGDDPYQVDTLTLVQQAQQALAEVAGVDPALAEHESTLTTVITLLEEVSRDLSRYAADLDSEGPAQLQEAQERKAQLTALKRNYGPELSDVIAYVAEASERLVTLDDDDSRVAQLGDEVAALSEEEQRLADQLTAARTAKAAELGDRVTQELRALALPEAHLLVEVSPAPLSHHGADEVVFLLKGHAAAQPRPLAKTASGGELSRIMLALEVVVSETDPVPTFVFDEVDAGIGGAAAIEIGRRLRRLSRSAQVIVVTHLAQVAAFADRHLRVTKDHRGGFTESSCSVLDPETRETEIARLLSGLDDSESAREHARELLEMGRAE